MNSAWSVALGALAVAFAQQPPPIENARVETRSAAAGLDAAMRQLVAAPPSDPAWVGYSVPAVAGQQQTCWSDQYASTVHLEGPKEFYILYRIHENRIERIRTFSPDCVIDGGNAAFVWLTQVKPAESVAFLGSIMQDTARRHPDGALGAIAVHAAPEATAFLLQTARTDQSARRRGQALFWLARTAPPQVSEPAIQEAIDKDPAAEVQRQAAAALYQIPHNEGIPLLLRLASDHGKPTVQKQAMFWLGRSKDPRAAKFFEEVLGR
jgi:hypothetical protein